MACSCEHFDYIFSINNNILIQVICRICLHLFILNKITKTQHDLQTNQLIMLINRPARRQLCLESKYIFLATICIENDMYVYIYFAEYNCMFLLPAKNVLNISSKSTQSLSPADLHPCGICARCCQGCALLGFIRTPTRCGY